MIVTSRWSIPIIALALGACATAPSSASRSEIGGTRWVLESIGGAAPIAGAQPTLAFGDQYRISGAGGCNQFFGVYGVDGGEVTIRDLGATRMACDAAIMAQEQAYFDVLRNAESIVVGADGRLTITTGDGRQAVLAPHAA